MATPYDIIKDALNLKPSEKAEVIDKLLTSLDKPDAKLDKLWAEEAESRIDAYEQGKLKAVTLKEVLKKYR